MKYSKYLNERKILELDFKKLLSDFSNIEFRMKELKKELKMKDNIGTVDATKKLKAELDTFAKKVM